MFKKIKSKITVKNYVITVCSIFAIIALVMSLSHLNEVKADESEKDYSFYKIASAAATYFNESQSPEGDGVDAKWTQSAAGASLLGFPDSEKNQGVVGWLTSKLSASSITYSYSALTQSATKIDNGFMNMNDDSAGNGLISYALYGATLNGLGLDSTAPDMPLSLGRLAGGFLLYVFFGLATSVDLLMSVSLKILQVLNPFQFFGGALKSTLGGGIGSAFDGAKAAGPFAGLVNFVSGWYQSLYQLSWAALFPIFIAITLFTMLMFKKTSKGSAMKKLIIRLSFGIILFPLVGSTYTATINKMTNMTSEGSLGSTQVIMSTFVDFERWASEYRLAKPSNAVVGWNSKIASPTINSQAAVRSTAFAINAQSYGLSNLNLGKPDNSASSVVNFNKAMSKTVKSSGDADALKASFSIIDRFMSASRYQSSDWETSVKSAITNGKTGTPGSKPKPGENGDGENKGQEYLDAADVEKYKDGTITPKHKYHKTNGNVNLSGGGYFQTTGSKVGVSGNGMLSHIGMYNYLNTSFNKTNMEVFSSSKASSGFVRKSHFSVNLVGTGAMKLLYFLNAITLLICFTILGVSYGFGLIVSNIRRGISMITSVPLAMVGSVRYIARVFVYTSVMIIEVIGTFFMYLFSQAILLSLPQVVEAPLAEALNKVPALGETAAITVVISSLSLILLVMFTFQCIKMRKHFIRSADETMKNILEKFFGVDSGVDLGSQSGKNPLISGAKGLAGGLAMGAMTGGGSLGATALASGLKGIVGDSEDDDKKDPNSPDDAGGTFEDDGGPNGPKGEKSDKDDTLGSSKDGDGKSSSEENDKSMRDEADKLDDAGSLGSAGSSSNKSKTSSKGKVSGQNNSSNKREYGSIIDDPQDEKMFSAPDKNGFSVDEKGRIYNSDGERVDPLGRRVDKNGLVMPGELARSQGDRPTAGTESLAKSIREDATNKKLLGTGNKITTSEILTKFGYVIEGDRLRKYDDDGNLTEDYKNTKTKRAQLASSIVDNGKKIMDAKGESSKADSVSFGGSPKTTMQKNIDNMKKYAKSGDLAKDVAIGYMTGNVKGQVVAGALKNTEQGKAIVNKITGNKANSKVSVNETGANKTVQTVKTTSDGSAGVYNGSKSTSKNVSGSTKTTNVKNKEQVVSSTQRPSVSGSGTFNDKRVPSNTSKSVNTVNRVDNKVQDVINVSKQNTINDSQKGNGFIKTGKSTTSVERNVHNKKVENVENIVSNKNQSVKKNVNKSTTKVKSDVQKNILDSNIKKGTSFVTRKPKKK